MFSKVSWRRKGKAEGRCCAYSFQLYKSSDTKKSPTTPFEYGHSTSRNCRWHRALPRCSKWKWWTIYLRRAEDKKKYFLAKETFAKTFLISFWFNSVIWCQYKKIFQYCSSCSFLYLLGNPEKALYCNITILQVSNKSFHWTNLIEQHVEDYWYKFMARQSFNSSFTLFVQKSRSIV